jgi:hypothetical protein
MSWSRRFPAGRLVAVSVIELVSLAPACDGGADRGAKDLSHDFDFTRKLRPPDPLRLRTDC